MNISKWDLIIVLFILKRVSYFLFLYKNEALKVANGKKSMNDDKDPSPEMLKAKVKFEVYGEEMIEKRVKMSGNSGRVYLPPDWIGHQVKIIRID